jgi:predicted Zn finger-like uncharacterized protein
MGFLDMRAEIGDLDGRFSRASDSSPMILTCPECATGYFVDDAQIRPDGRAVRCAACGARWTAVPETPLELSPAAAAAAEPGAETDTSAPLTADDLPRAFRSRAEEERRLRQAAITGAAWAAGALVLAALVLGAVLFRESVVRAWPQTASVYAALGLPVNPVGLVIEDVRAEPSLQEGHATLAVSGAIRNVEDHPVMAPPLRISLLNRQGKRVAGQIAALANARIPPGETRRFTTAIFDPPFSGEDLQVDFAVGAKGSPVSAGQTSPAAQAPAFDLRGPASGAAKTAPAANAVPAASTPAVPSQAVAPATNAAVATHG